MNNKSIIQNIVITLLIPLFIMGCGPQAPDFKIKGYLENMKGGELYIYNLSDENAHLDTITIRNGKFSYEGTANGIVPYILLFPNAVEQVIFAEGGKSLKYKSSLNDLKNYTIDGSETNELMNEIRQKINAESNQPTIKNIAAHYIKTYPDSPVALYLIDRYFSQEDNTDVNTLKSLYETVKLVQPDNLEVLSLGNKITTKKGGKIGQTIPDIKMETFQKDSISLNEFKNKYTLIFFWASWQDDPYLILDNVHKFYKKYGKENDIKVISVSLDGAKYQWEGYVREDTANIVHCYDGLTWESPAVKKLGVTRIPYYILADKKHKITAVSNNLDALQDGLEPTTP